ncbi:MAG: HlyD family efflux transporter periplasmic adaptor subunit [Planctomycetales bacterium]|nr:HlyD family efflux transporter periplasmic adaptor subunit [Planctomycetales bacterium]NIM07704.1 HlyD family efflux transporter periplasmic adaptor subunit [Planctomycetales bacterium]NIN07208.1 HlyD family efflux transporter periplasmic adaptor subunit [Planctomycetales bacterium]NIN76301.1 HlyD family efflux transporter periplasmic adaptor subunit [Planctomycetales bacterium]NIO33506.1 HlyD family efflux transporter periplasmic adaptor subunit [Planctomycetales bacterium]
MTPDVDLSQLAIPRDASAARRTRWQIVTRYVIPAALAAGLLMLVAWAARDLLLPARPVRVIPVLVSQATTGREGTPLFQAAGWVQPRPTAIRVAAMAPGVVQQLLVVEGQAVRAGDPIARLVADDAELALRRAIADRQLREAELARCQVTLQAATLRYERPLPLQASLAEANAQLAKIETERTKLPFEIQRAESRVELARKNLAGKQQAGDVVSGRQLDQARSELETATARLQELRQRVAPLQQEKDALVGRRDVLRTQLELKADEVQARDEAVTAVRAAEARLEQARIAEAEANLRRKRMTVRAPIDGRVLRLIAQPGSRLMAEVGHTADHDASTVVTMYRPELLQVRVDVRFEDLPRVQEGQPVRIESPTLAKPLIGQVLFLGSLADIQKNTLQVYVAIPQPPAVLAPEMLVNVTFLAAAEPGGDNMPAGQLRLYVPETLVEQTDSGAFVWVANQNAGVARRVAVQTGPVLSNRLVQIHQGLTASSRLITSGHEGLQDGDRIRVTGEDDRPATLFDPSPPDPDHAPLTQETNKSESP